MFLRNRISSNPLTEARDSSLKESRRPGRSCRLALERLECRRTTPGSRRQKGRSGR